jgi:hypothetical protein
MSDTTIKSVAELMKALGGNTAFAKMIGVRPSTASEMKRRGRIPPEYWQDLVEAANALGHREVTAELLMRLHARHQQGAGTRGFAENDAPAFEPGTGVAKDADRQTAQGHFTRFKHLRRPIFRTAEEIEEHIRALREEWSHR